MARKTRSKYANQSTPGPAPSTSTSTPSSPSRPLVSLVNLSAATRQFLATMNQDRRVCSEFSKEELERLVPPADVRLGVFTELLDKLKFQAISVPEGTPDPIPIEVDEEDNDEEHTPYFHVEDMGDANDAIAACGSYTNGKTLSALKDDEHYAVFLENLKRLALLFNIIPAPHQCPPPPPCVRLHVEDAPPPPTCPRLHAEDAPAPPPCSLPHRGDDEAPMEATPPPHSCLSPHGALPPSP
ncbi:hypothetical protein P691DRAFT_766186 [Macrolepiota fuliginosa MF-IS2]|uniref:Uncharacterized protein n=1 Tax=Macrolepiota fuliginosa MF-IS2 TaxID=1400762 RepID=A0A9P6BXI9_9AGAR|nr:hypothetical protein P691DRAFT_766186 [Macrolepiota fuliginosa MF-IS2]